MRRSKPHEYFCYDLPRVERQLSIRDLKPCNEGLQSPLPKHVAWRTVVTFESTGNGGSSDIYIHAGLSEPINQDLPCLCTLRPRTIQFFYSCLGLRYNVVSRKRESGEARRRSARDHSNIRCIF